MFAAVSPSELQSSTITLCFQKDFFYAVNSAKRMSVTYVKKTKLNTWIYRRHVPQHLYQSLKSFIKNLSSVMKIALFSDWYS